MKHANATRAVRVVIGVMLGSVALAVAPACGGKAAPKAAAVDSEKAAYERDAKIVFGWRDRACACTDRGCATQVDREIAETLDSWTASEDPLATMKPVEDDPLHVLDAVPEIFQCLAKHQAGKATTSMIAERAFAHLRDSVCACHETSCAWKARPDYNKTMARYGNLPADEPTLEALRRMGEEIGRCFLETDALVVEDQVLEVKTLRKRACECEDAACGQQVKAAFYEWVDASAEQATTNQHRLEEFGDLGREIGECLVAAGVDPRRDPPAPPADPDDRRAWAMYDVKSLHHRACLCSDASCADGVQTDFDAFLEEYKDLKATEQEAVEVGHHAKSMAACLEEARASDQPAAP